MAVISVIESEERLFPSGRRSTTTADLNRMAPIIDALVTELGAGQVLALVDELHELMGAELRATFDLGRAR